MIRRLTVMGRKVARRRSPSSGTRKRSWSRFVLERRTRIADPSGDHATGAEPPVDRPGEPGGSGFQVDHPDVEELTRSGVAGVGEPPAVSREDRVLVDDVVLGRPPLRRPVAVERPELVTLVPAAIHAEDQSVRARRRHQL